MENTSQGSSPTTSDISMFMRKLGFEWSNDAQIYYHDNLLGYEHISRKTAERLFKLLFISDILKEIK